MSISLHARKLAVISKNAYSSLRQHRTKFKNYLNITSSLWNIHPIDTLDAFIQFFIYLSYRTYLGSSAQEKFANILNKKRFTAQFASFFLIDRNIPIEIQEFLIAPIFREILSWNLPDKEELDSSSVFLGVYLQHYKSSKAKEAGIIYTPKFIVDFIIQGIDTLIVQIFGIKNGLRNPEFPYKIIDPASGTMNFIIGLLNFMNGSKNHPQPINNHILTMELNPISYVLGLDELKPLVDISTKLHNFYLGNTLSEESYSIMNRFLGSDQKSISLILGNPPYYINTQNNHPWIQSEILAFKQDLEEKNLKILSDDYIKFFRVSQKLFQEENRRGILAFVTNNNYLDGIVFKSMRKSFLETFSNIYIVNLHGNLRKNETGNPFNIKVGISIIFLVRNYSNYQKSDIKPNGIFYWDVDTPNLRDKFTHLTQGFNLRKFQQIELTPDCFFTPRDINKEEKFLEFISLPDLFKLPPKSGIMTGRDSLVSNPDKRILEENLQLFFEKQTDALNRLNIKVHKTKTWDPDYALNHTSLQRAQNSITPYFYRGFIKTYLIYDNYLVDGCRLGYLNAISTTNPAICVTRSIRSSHFSHVLMVDSPPEKCLLGIRDSSYVFLQRTPENLQKFNLIPPSVKFSLSPEMLFYYIYGVLFSEAYRKRYIEQLKRHFPRIPFPKDDGLLFDTMSNLGMQIAMVHLGKLKMDLSEFDTINTANLLIQDFYYDPHKQKICFGRKENNTVVKGITPQMWDYEIGSIRQLEFWLKSRVFKEKSDPNKKRHLGLSREITESELLEFLSLCAKIKYTLEMLPKIDGVYNQIDVE